jgi:hypothetical protein
VGGNSLITARLAAYRAFCFRFTLQVRAFLAQYGSATRAGISKPVLYASHPPGLDLDEIRLEEHRLVISTVDRLDFIFRRQGGAGQKNNQEDEREERPAFSRLPIAELYNGRPIL